VRLVDETIQLLAVPAHAEVDPGTERVGHPTQDIEGNLVGATAFDGADVPAAHTGAVGEILLTKPAADPERSQRGSDGQEIHAPRMAAADALRLISPSTIAQQ
jgi:hypothetical protein